MTLDYGYSSLFLYVIWKVELFLQAKISQEKELQNAWINKICNRNEIMFLVISSVEAGMFRGSSDLLNVKVLIRSETSLWRTLFNYRGVWL